MKALLAAMVALILERVSSRREGRPLARGLASTNSTGNTACNQEMMVSYGLTGHSFSQVSSHLYCPMITDNCCTLDDQKNSLTLWNTEYRPKIERYYEVYLYSVKYILGFSTEVNNLAKSLATSTNVECKNSAAEIQKMNLSPKVTADIYNAFVQSLEKMGSIRRGFFCTLCDARAQKELTDYWSIVNLFYRDRIYYSKEFCAKLVDYTIRASYFTTYYLKTFADNAASLINCKAGNSTRVVFEVDFWTKQQVKNCYYFKSKYFFFFCENYCEKFHLVKPSDILDGNLPQLKKFVDHIRLNRNKAFSSPSNNILMDGITYEEDYLKDYTDDAMKTEVMIKSSVERVSLDKFKTDVVYTGGMNPWDSVDKSGYPLTLASSALLSAALSTLLLLLS